MTYDELLIEKHFNKSILVDTNLLLLFIYGYVDRDNISTKKRTNKYSPDDFDLLYRILQRFNKIIYTPHILTEVSNLLEKDNNRFYYQVAATVQNLISAKNEIYVQSDVLVLENPFLQFGLADTGIYNVAKSGILIITDDLPLYGYLSGQDLDVINFSHLRGLSILSET